MLANPNPVSDVTTTVFTRRVLPLGLAVWFYGVLTLCALGLFTPMPPPLLLAIIPVGMAVLVARVPSLRVQVDGLGPRGLSLVHVVRLVVAMAVEQLYTQGQLPARLAIPAIVGATIFGLTAPLAALVAGSRHVVARWATVVWNAGGIVELMVVLGFAQAVLLRHPNDLDALTTVPGGIIPMFIVPLMLVSHALVIRRAVMAR